MPSMQALSRRPQAGPTASRKPTPKRVQAILGRVAEAYPAAKCTLDHTSALELLVATILSAQCTDDRVNVVTKDLFRKYRSAEDYVRVPQDELEQDVHTCGFYRNKAKAIQGTCRLLLERHGGKVPRTMEAMLELPGVARKTASVVLGNAYGVIEGIVVDTHVARLARRMGLTRQRDPDKIERDLMGLVPRAQWLSLSHRLIAHGRRICDARRPVCGECTLNSVCPSAFLPAAQMLDKY